MQTSYSDAALGRMTDRPRTLITHAGAVWLWPGIPLAVKLSDGIESAPAATVQFWASRLHGFEADPASVQTAFRCALEYLGRGDEAGAQRALNRAGLDRVSPEGAVLVRAVARRLNVEPPDFLIGTRSAPWGAVGVASDLLRFDGFAGSAARLEKAWDSSKHPRWPPGTDGGQGGRFSPVGAIPAAGSSRAAPELPQHELLSPESQNPGIGHNGGPPLEDPPEIPLEEPSTTELRNKIIKVAARWLLKAILRGAAGPVGDFLTVLDIARWLYENYPYIRAYLDAPKTLYELQGAAGESKEGYQIHHIVEQTPARKDGYPESQIESKDNRVRISTLKHWEITGWYMRPNKRYKGLSA